MKRDSDVVHGFNQSLEDLTIIRHDKHPISTAPIVIIELLSSSRAAARVITRQGGRPDSATSVAVRLTPFVAVLRTLVQ
jgi:hypothetical protein